MGERADDKGLTGSDVLREAAVEGALHALLTSAPAALRAFLSPSRLVGAGEWSVSRDTAYRLFRDQDGLNGGDAVVAACSAKSIDQDWNGVTATVTELANAYLDEGSNVLERLTAAMEANVVSSFDSIGWPLGHTLQGAAIAASPRWIGPRPTDPTDLAVARVILDDRRRHYDELTDLYEPFVRRIMSDTGLRPAGRTIRQVLRLIHCLIDGTVLRMFVDPTLETADVVEAIVRFGLCLGEPGAINDPRRPGDPGRASVFDAIIGAAQGWWAAQPNETAPHLQAIADRADVAEAAMTMLLPSSSDLADSVLRAMLVDGGFLGSDSDLPNRSMIPMIVIGGLERLVEAADRFPGPFAIVAETEPLIGPSLRSESTNAVAALLTELDFGGNADESASVLTNAAWNGRSSLAEHADTIAAIRRLTSKSERV
jgi:hypothetical protein